MARFSKNRLFSRFVGKLNQSSQITSTGIASGAVDEGVTVYDSAGLLPSSGMSAGDQAWSGNRLYISNGSGWYNVALVNADPRFVSITDSDGGTTPFALATDGATPITITLVGADSDGVDVTYSYTKDAGFDGLATISGSGTEYTVTPLSEDSATTSSGTVTFKVSDGISFASSVNTFTLSFAADWSAPTVKSSVVNGTTNPSYSTSAYMGSIQIGPTVGDEVHFGLEKNAYIHIYSMANDGSLTEIQTIIRSLAAWCWAGSTLCVGYRTSTLNGGYITFYDWDSGTSQYTSSQVLNQPTFSNPYSNYMYGGSNKRMQAINDNNIVYGYDRYSEGGTTHVGLWANAYRSGSTWYQGSQAYAHNSSSTGWFSGTQPVSANNGLIAGLRNGSSGTGRLNVRGYAGGTQLNMGGNSSIDNTGSYQWYGTVAMNPAGTKVLIQTTTGGVFDIADLSTYSVTSYTFADWPSVNGTPLTYSALYSINWIDATTIGFGAYQANYYDGSSTTTNAGAYFVATESGGTWTCSDLVYQTTDTAEVKCFAGIEPITTANGSQYLLTCDLGNYNTSPTPPKLTVWDV